MHMKVDENYNGSFLWQNNISSPDTFYSNAYGD
jgi:hypothetical protein